MTQTDISVAAEGVWYVVGELSFETVPELFAKSRRLDRGQSDLIVDLGGVTRANSAGLVLLLEWLSEGRRLQRGVSFRNLPDSLRDIAGVSNAMDLLPLVADETGATAAATKTEAVAAPAPKKRQATTTAKKKVGPRRKKRKPRRWR